MVKNQARILQGAFQRFLRFSYETVSTSDLEEEIGLTRGAIYYTYKSKEELFRAVIDTFILSKQNVWEKIQVREELIDMLSLREYLTIYLNGAEKTIDSMRQFVKDGTNGFQGYFSLLYQARLYYPNFNQLIYETFFQELELIRRVVTNAVRDKEIPPIDIDIVAHHLRYIFIGHSFEESFKDGMQKQAIRDYLMYYYKLLRNETGLP